MATTLFDSHLHIIDPRFPLYPNNGFLPDPFTSSDYLARLEPYDLAGGCVVSGSFQRFDQSYLIYALDTLGDNFVGVTQLPADTSDEEILTLNQAGIRAIRFNIKRGGSEDISQMEYLAHRIYELANWHIELYIDSTALADLSNVLTRLPAVTIDHLGLSKAGFNTLLSLAGKGVKVKATGFGRIDFDAASAIQELYKTNPNALMFGTDLPSTRAPRPFSDDDFDLVLNCLDDVAARKVLFENAQAFYLR